MRESRAWVWLKCLKCTGNCVTYCIFKTVWNSQFTHSFRGFSRGILAQMCVHRPHIVSLWSTDLYKPSSTAYILDRQHFEVITSLLPLKNSHHSLHCVNCDFYFRNLRILFKLETYFTFPDSDNLNTYSYHTHTCINSHTAHTRTHAHTRKLRHSEILYILHSPDWDNHLLSEEYEHFIDMRLHWRDKDTIAAQQHISQH